MNSRYSAPPSDSWCKIHFADSELKVVRASKQYVYDEAGNEYLDCVSTAAHVGHCHPHVVAAGQAQMLKLWTGLGFLHDTYSKYIKELSDILPENLSVIYLVNSGSEANDLALRLARLYTKRDDVAVFEGSYHGNLSSLVDISSKSFKRLPQGKKDFVHILPLPKTPANSDGSSIQDGYHEFLEQAEKVIERAKAKGRPIGTFMSEIVISAAGVMFPPRGYFKELYEVVRKNGGICIADEIQTGLGRTGNYWAFQAYGVVPDILTVGKPLGNGFPMAALATSREIASVLPEYMSTYGGNPLACAVGRAVLEVISNEKLVSASKMVGKFLLEGLRGLMPKYPCIGEVRGMGLCVGVEIVCGRPDMKPASNLAARLLYKLKEERIVIATQGEERNVMAVVPPLCFTLDNARRLIESFDRALAKAQMNDDLSSESNGNSSFLGLADIPADILSVDVREDEADPAKRPRLYEEMD